ncbi:hypothetical protein HDU84_006736 [Entophlyctis sp. JEL0112]|nr:hypothetical protein HDU84_006736 [Entophlyctis sp. JEL0112]
MGSGDNVLTVTLLDHIEPVQQAISPPPAYAPAGTRVVLWVDDCPQNNAAIIAAAKAMGIQVLQATSTQEAIAFLDKNAWSAWDFRVITDMHRIERGFEVKDAGIRFIKDLNYRKPPFPVLLYCSWTGNIDVWKREFSAVRLDATNNEDVAKKNEKVQ